MRIQWLAAGLVAAGMLVLGGAPARAASFDCARAGTPMEKAICSSPALSRTDEALAAIYAADLARLSSAGHTTCATTSALSCDTPRPCA